MKSYKEILAEYFPESSVPVVYDWIKNNNVQLKISKNRTTKLGDYRPPQGRYNFHRISINHDLNKYNFLITFVHEFAHLKNWEKHNRSVKPHGKEWKTKFSELMQNFMNVEVFPGDILNVLIVFLKNPTSSSVNISLSKKLREYDTNSDYLTLEELPHEALFRIHNGFVFKKLEKLRKRYKCKRLDNNRIYLVSPIAEVVMVENY